ncbi:unnamed protein product, partial [Durusdinium trenchii]
MDWLCQVQSPCIRHVSNCATWDPSYERPITERLDLRAWVDDASWLNCKENLGVYNRPERIAAHELAAAACLKLARNLSVENAEIQARWWRRGLPERLAVQARCDLAAPGGERSAAWCEAVPSFMANVVANNPELRKEALEALWPHGLAAVLAI